MAKTWASWQTWGKVLEESVRLRTEGSLKIDSLFCIHLSYSPVSLLPLSRHVSCKNHLLSPPDTLFFLNPSHPVSDSITQQNMVSVCITLTTTLPYLMDIFQSVPYWWILTQWTNKPLNLYSPGFYDPTWLFYCLSGHFIFWYCS